MYDIRLAEALGFGRPRDIRKLIQGNLNELRGYAEICAMAAQIDGAGRPTSEYWLTEEQALFLCMRSNAERAKVVRAEIIDVFQAWRRGKLVPASRAVVTLDALSALFDRKLDPVHERITAIEGNVTFLTNRIDDIVPRREFPADVKRQFRYVCGRRYNGECPCCRRTKIVDSNFESLPGLNYDHYRGRELNGAEDGWVVCQRCNLELRNSEFKNAARKHFDVFQEYRRDLQAGHPPKLKSISHSEQFKLNL